MNGLPSGVISTTPLGFAIMLPPPLSFFLAAAYAQSVRDLGHQDLGPYALLAN
jgi:hypothetical protein